MERLIAVHIDMTDTLALRGGKVAAYLTKLRFGFCGVYIDRE
jgi:hypothetical protein